MSTTMTMTPWQDELGFIPHLPGAPEAINADSFDEDVLESPVPALIEFWMARCGPCRRLAPELQAVAAEYAGKLRVFTLNVDEELPAAARFGVHSVPAILLFIGGKEVSRVLGVTDRITLSKLIAEHLQQPKKE